MRRYDSGTILHTNGAGEIHMGAALPQAMCRLIDFLGELGPRWGLPEEACRLHGYLYLRARPATEGELCKVLGLDRTAVEIAVSWLADYRLIEPAQGAGWQTKSDPWELMVNVLDERRRREAGPALETLRECRRIAVAENPRDAVLSRQIGKLLALAEDLVAIDAQARRLSPGTLRQIVEIGGRTARFIDRAFGKRRG
jgi:DNA-binding transcriptional regulator GbsR (MarR family)